MQWCLLLMSGVIQSKNVDCFGFQQAFCGMIEESRPISTSSWAEAILISNLLSSEMLDVAFKYSFAPSAVPESIFPLKGLSTNSKAATILTFGMGGVLCLNKLRL